MKILIVDDSDDVRNLLRKIIEMHGHTALEAADGQEGIEKITADKPDLVITDTLMPRMDGFQFLRNVKSDKTLKSIPIVVYSGVYTGSNDRELTLSLGASAFIAKPHRPEIFWEELHAIIKNIQGKNPVVEEEPIEEEDVFLKNYSRIVTAKLEEKVKELEAVIAENKQHEKALDENKELLQAILNNTSTPIYLKDIEGRYLLINRQFEKLLHLTREQIIGKTDYDLFPNDKKKADVFRMNDRKAIEMKTSLTLEEVVPLDNSLLTYISVKFPLYDTVGNVYGVCGISTDITERKRTESAIRSVTERISSLTGKSFFLSLVQHIASILNVDYVFIGMLTDDGKEVKTIAVYAHGSIVDNITYKLAKTPCADVINIRSCVYAKGVQKQFPDDRLLVEMGVESYAGTPLFNSNGKPLGILTAMSCNELVYPEQAESLLLLFAARTSAELERQQAEALLQKSEARLTNAQRIAHLGNWEWNIVKNDLWWSAEIYRIFGIAHQKFGATYEAFLNTVHPDDREFVKESVDLALQGKAPYSINHRIVLPDGSERIVHDEAEVIFDASGKAMQMNGTVQDVTEYKQAEEEIKKLFTAIDQSINTVFITNVKGNIEYVNPMFEQVTGYTKKEALGQNPHILASGETAHAVYEELWNAITTGKTWRGIFKNKKKNGHYYWGSGLITPIKNGNGQITHFLAVQEDITDKMRAEERIEYLVSYDELTSLFNRARFVELLREWITGAKTSNQPGTLLLIDIDGFRLINDTHGHSTGDIVLVHIARFLNSTLSEIDSQYANKAAGKSILSRFGGDEFAIFLPGRSEREGLETAEEIRKRLMIFKFPEISGYLTASIGMVVYPREGNTTKELITKADASVYHAKELGHNTVHLYHANDLMMEKLHSRMEWKGRIQKAIEEDRFEPWFQPILDLRDNQVHHYEALARKRGVHGAIILPGSFVDAAEGMGLITAIDRIIIRKTMSAQSLLRKQGRNYSFSMNLSGKDLDDKSLLDFLQSAITETGADPKNLIFEITETAAVRDFDRAVKFIGELRSIGCCFSLDDFGVGFTSFKYLKEMKVDYIKIDGSFIRKLNEDQTDRLFVRAMAIVARGMGVKTIAEFIENSQTINILREFGVDYGQGYFIGKPAPNI